MPKNDYKQYLEHTIHQFRNDKSYNNYLCVRDNVISMLDEEYGNWDVPSKYWEEELAGFDYLFDASPLLIRKLREHSYHITGLKSYEYRRHHAHKSKSFKIKLSALRSVDISELFVSEAPELGGFGHNIDGKLVNIDTLKFYESLIALDRGGEINRLRNAEYRPLVVEIGGGWGGFAYQFKKIIPNSAYIIIDLPQTLLFSGTYLKTLYPEAKFFIYGDNGLQRPADELNSYDFILMPHFSIKDFFPSNVQLGINMISFQEMTTGQVLGYIKWLWECGCQVLYSHNRIKSAHNTELTSVYDLLNCGFDAKEIKVLPVPYTVLTVPTKFTWSKDPTVFAKQILKRMLFSSLNRTAFDPGYRHMIGKRLDAFSGVNNG